MNKHAFTTADTEGEESETARDTLFVSSLAKAMQVLEAFAGVDALGLTEIAQRCNMTKSGAQRFVHTWCQLGYLQKVPGRRLALTHKVVERSYDFLGANPLVSRATPHLVDARDRCGQNVNLSVRDGADIVYLARIPSHRQQLSTLLAGRRLPAFCTSGGRAILAQLPDAEVEQLLRRSPLKPLTAFTETRVEAVLHEIQRAREQGFAVAEQQVLVGEIAVAAAVVDATGQAIGAVHIAALLDEFPRTKAVEQLAQQAMATARVIAGR